LSTYECADAVYARGSVLVDMKQFSICTRHCVKINILFDKYT